MSKIKKKPVLLFFIAVIILYVIIYIVPKLTGTLLSSYTVEYGSLKIVDESQGYLVRNEQVYVAGNSGRQNTYFKEGTLISVGRTVMEVSGETPKNNENKFEELTNALGDRVIRTTTYTTKMGGIVSYHIDGNEKNLTPYNMNKLSYNDFQGLKGKVQYVKRNEVVEGEPVFKIIDRTKWYIVCYVDKNHGSRYKLGNKIQIRLGDNRDTIEGEIYKASQEGDKFKIIIKSDYYCKEFLKNRVSNVTLISSDVKGLIVLNSSIVEKKGQKGVYVKGKSNKYVFVPVQVLSTDEEKSAVADTVFYDGKGNPHYTIETYDEILKTPDE